MTPLVSVAFGGTAGKKYFGCVPLLHYVTQSTAVQVHPDLRHRLQLYVIEESAGSNLQNALVCNLQLFYAQTSEKNDVKRLSASMGGAEACRPNIGSLRSPGAMQGVILDCTVP